MPKKKITLSVDSETYNNYRDHCEEQGIIISKQVELFIKKELERIKSEKK